MNHKQVNSSDNFTNPVNLGNPKGMCIFEIDQKIIELTGSKSRIV